MGSEFQVPGSAFHVPHLEGASTVLGIEERHEQSSCSFGLLNLELETRNPELGNSEPLILSVFGEHFVNRLPLSKPEPVVPGFADIVAHRKIILP
jgi:hypothetical protein